MRARGLLAVLLLGSMSQTILCAHQFMPEWLPPIPPQKPVWDLFQEAPASQPGEEFSDLLIQLSRPVERHQRVDQGRFKLSRTAQADHVNLQSTLDLADQLEFRHLPYRDWRAEESVRMPLPVAESMFVFGNLDSEGASLDHQMVRMKGRTGLGWKWSTYSGTEMQVRTGPVVSYADTSLSAKGVERSQLSVEMQAKLALYGPLQLQYSGEALPAFAQTDRHTLLSDLKLALPFGTNREVYLGARYRWEDTLTPTPWVDRAEIYMGLKFQH